MRAALRLIDARTVYTLWKVRLNDDGLGPQPELTDFPYLVNETIKWIYNKQYDNLLPYGGTLANIGVQVPK